MSFFIEQVRNGFPLIHAKTEQPLVYFDNAATAQKPHKVLSAMDTFYQHYNSNIHRGVYSISEKATAVFEDVRSKVAEFMSASHEEIVFTRSATEAINLLAFSIGETLETGDEILISEMEHHSNIVPWYLLAKRKGLQLKVVPVTDDGEIDMDQLEALLTPKVKVVAITHASNVLGTVNPIAEIAEMASNNGSLIIVDGSQAVPHMPVHMQNLGVDAYVWTGHKFFGPTGTGVLYARKQLLDKLPPYQGGGDMIETVSFEKITFREAPYKFEAGTPNIAGVIGLGAAIDYVLAIGYDEIMTYEKKLADKLEKELRTMQGVTIIGSAKNRVPVFSFVVDEVHPHDVGSFLDSKGVCVRTGQHCAEPLMKRFGISSTTRASLSFYNTSKEVDYFISSLEETISLLS